MRWRVAAADRSGRCPLSAPTATFPPLPTFPLPSTAADAPERHADYTAAEGDYAKDKAAAAAASKDKAATAVGGKGRRRVLRSDVSAAA